MIEVKQVPHGTYPKGVYLMFPSDTHLESAIARFIERFRYDPEEWFICTEPPGKKGLYVGPLPQQLPKSVNP